MMAFLGQLALKMRETAAALDDPEAIVEVGDGFFLSLREGLTEYEDDRALFQLGRRSGTLPGKDGRVVYIYLAVRPIRSKKPPKPRPGART